MKYKIEWTEIVRYYSYVEAKSEKDAEQLLYDKYNNLNKGIIKAKFSDNVDDVQVEKIK